MTKVAILFLAMAAAVFLTVCDAKRHPHTKSANDNVASTLQSPSLTNELDNAITSDVTTEKSTNKNKKSVAKSILNAILSTICGEGRRFNLKKARCTGISSISTYAFGNPSLGK